MTTNQALGLGLGMWSDSPNFVVKPSAESPPCPECGTPMLLVDVKFNRTADQREMKAYMCQHHGCFDREQADALYAENQAKESK